MIVSSFIEVIIVFPSDKLSWAVKSCLRVKKFRGCWVLPTSLSFSADTSNIDDLRNQQWDFSDLGKNLASLGVGLSKGNAQG